MRDKFWLFIVVGKAALITTAGCFVPLLGLKVPLTRNEQGMLWMIAVVLSIGIATWWIFRELQAGYTRREARAATTTFAILTPMSLGIAILLSPFPGGYAEMFLGSSFVLVGVVVGVIAITTLLNFLLCLFTLWMTRRIIKLESTQ